MNVVTRTSHRTSRLLYKTVMVVSAHSGSYRAGSLALSSDTCSTLYPHGRILQVVTSLFIDLLVSAPRYCLCAWCVLLTIRVRTILLRLPVRSSAVHLTTCYFQSPYSSCSGTYGSLVRLRFPWRLLTLHHHYFTNIPPHVPHCLFSCRPCL